jgi:hypothetical protein
MPLESAYLSEVIMSRLMKRSGPRGERTLPLTGAPALTNRTT